MFSNSCVGWVKRSATQQSYEKCWVTLREGYAYVPLHSHILAWGVFSNSCVGWVKRSAAQQSYEKCWVTLREGYAYVPQPNLQFQPILGLKTRLRVRGDRQRLPKLHELPTSSVFPYSSST